LHLLDLPCKDIGENSIFFHSGIKWLFCPTQHHAMASRFKPLIKAFGPADGIKFYLQFKAVPHGYFHSAKYGASFFLRKNFSVPIYV